jgi:hypothetical protein
MRARCRAIHGFIRTLGVMFVTLSLVHTPLPRPDFHNIRHHDAPGEVCEFHDHLLRWHPGAGVASDVSVLHWHWFLPSEPEPGDNLARGVPAVHAHAPDWQTATWESAPPLAPAGLTSSRLIPRPGSGPFDFLIVPSASAFLAVTHTPGMPSTLASRATIAPGVGLFALHQRWDC